MLKKEIKNIFSEIPLYCIASFVIGAYTVLLINFFWFDNHITPPGVSALVACMALLFTIYAAFKVKEWNENKKNDKAFSQTEKLLDTLTRLYIVKNRLIKPLTNLRFHGRTINKDIISDIDTIANQISDLVSEAHSVTVSLELWGASLSSKLQKNIDNLDGCIRNLTLDLWSMKYLDENPEKNPYTAKVKNCFENISKIDTIFSEMFKRKHHELFHIENR